jgi:quinol monooxygenase YgiN
MRLIVLATIEIHPDDTTAAVALAQAMAAATQAEVGCIQYSFGLDILRRNCLLLSERWRDAEALALHFKTAHMATFVKGLRGLRVEKLEAVQYDSTNPLELQV